MTAVTAVATDASATVDTANHIQSAWSKLKDPLLDTAYGVCDLFNNHKWKTWNVVVEWTGGQSCTREACTIQILHDPEKGRQDG